MRKGIKGLLVCCFLSIVVMGDLYSQYSLPQKLDRELR